MAVSEEDQDAYNQLAYYTLARKDPFFIHQLIVDTYAAQHADTSSKPIYTAFALAGLYLHNELGFTGKEVRRAHMRLAKDKKSLPTFTLPPDRGSMTVHDALKASEGNDRDTTIRLWSASTWESLTPVHQPVAAWLRQEKEI